MGDTGRVAGGTAVRGVINGRSTATALIDDVVAIADDALLEALEAFNEGGDHAGSMTSWHVGHSAQTPGWPALVSYSIRTFDAVISVRQRGHVPTREGCCAIVGVVLGSGVRTEGERGSV